MAKIDCSGADGIVSALKTLGKETPKVCKMALYKGAGVLLDQLRAATEALPTEPFHPLPGAPNGGEPLNVLTEDDKEDLLDGLGLAPFDDTGDGCSTAASFDGYSRHKTKKYPNGVPLPLIARSINSGSSARRKNPFIRRTVTAAEAPVQEAMENEVAAQVESIQQTGRLRPLEDGGGKNRRA